MSATEQATQEELVTIEIDGVPVQGRKGAMIIELADAVDIAIPRFCYHKKLSVAANCRMCLVQVEKAPKPLPACATPIMEGMKVFTQSDYARNAQKAIMEFLLINHPLDCPICDQGGECELQDLALGYGRDVSRFAERKRVVKEKYIGPLIATEMTRCIHCTRCIRFLDEIAGDKELGATGRGENMEIGTYIERAIASELSANVVELCPVGALTDKPYRYTARAWELQQVPSIAAHDAVGSNIYIHTRRGEIMRVVPRENEAVNETWISDRDRFSFQGLYSEDRLTRPMVKDNGQWKEVEWEDALAVAAQQLKDISTRSGDEIGALISPNATVEEMYLSQKLLRALGSEHIDYRLRQSDFRVSGNRVVPGLAIDIAQIEFLQTILLIGTNIRKEQPIIAHRIRKASLRGAQINVINPVDFDFHFSVQHKEIVAPPVMVEQLGAIAQAMSALCSTPMPASVRDLFAADVAQEQHHAIARQLHESPNAAVMLGAIATGHPDYSILCELASYITQNCGASFNLLPEGANAVGAWWSGAVPVAGQNEQAMSAAPMLRKHQEAYLLVDVEAELDCADAAEALKALSSARSVVVLTRYVTEQMRNYATVLLPTAGFAETSGTYVNAAGTWQSFAGATKPPGEARPGWKVLRVLGNQLALEGFDFNSSEDVLQAVQALDSRAWREVDWHAQETLDRLSVSGDLCRIGVAPIYAQDSLVRRAQALQETPDAQVVGAFMNSKVAAQYGLADGDQAKVTQAGAHAQLAVHIDERVADDSVWIPMGVEQCAGLGASFGRLELEKA